MPIAALHDRAEIAATLSLDPYRQAYALGDLDDFFWPYTQWYGLRGGDGALNAVALLYMAPGLPVLHAIAGDDPAPTRELLAGLLPLLPRQFYAHITPPLVDTLAGHYAVAAHGLHYKLGLRRFDAVDATDTRAATPLTVADRHALEALYTASYPGNWFDPRMLETGQYVGVWREAALVSVAGIHVFSPAYDVAALGNVTTHPAYRGQGLARVATAALCKQLRAHVAHISLNVHSDNTGAIRTYERLGFEQVAAYGEYTLT